MYDIKGRLHTHIYLHICIYAYDICATELIFVLTYRAGKINASNSVDKWRRIIFFDGGIPKAVAMVSPENDGSNTTKPPCTPLSVNFERDRTYGLPRPEEWQQNGIEWLKGQSIKGHFNKCYTLQFAWLFGQGKVLFKIPASPACSGTATSLRRGSTSLSSRSTLPLFTFSAQRVLYWGMPRATSSQARTCDARQRSIGSEEASRNNRIAPSAERALFLLRDLANTREILPQVPPRALRAVKFVPDLAGNFRTTAPVASESTGEPSCSTDLKAGPLSQVPSLKFKSPPVLSRSLLFLSTESFEQEFRSPVVFPELLLNADSEFELPRPLSSLRKLLVAVFGN
ncbi:hypothetical protein GQX74_005330 [Glossina fuscipes]|nr:hypothetical protein GQX74_005330 [Glossina fuscipes]